MNSNNNLISVIIPIYNAEKYLDKCIESLVNQTYINLEIILLDDGSVDISPAICDSWVKKDNRIKVLHIENGGVSNARNVGLDIATGDYIAFIDADDWIEADMYEKLLARLQDDDSDICVGGYITEENGREKITLDISEACHITKNNAMKICFQNTGKNLFGWSPCDKLYRRELWSDVRFDTSISMAEDFLAMWQILKKAERVSYFPIYKYHYVSVSNSATHTYSLKHRLDDCKAAKMVLDDCNNVDVELTKIIESRYECTLIKAIIKILLDDRYDMCDKIIEGRKYLKEHANIMNAELGERARLLLVCLLLPFNIIKFMMKFDIIKYIVNKICK